MFGVTSLEFFFVWVVQVGDIHEIPCWKRTARSKKKTWLGRRPKRFSWGMGEMGPEVFPISPNEPTDLGGNHFWLNDVCWKSKWWFRTHVLFCMRLFQMAWRHQVVQFVCKTFSPLHFLPLPQSMPLRCSWICFNILLIVTSCTGMYRYFIVPNKMRRRRRVSLHP